MRVPAELAGARDGEPAAEVGRPAGQTVCVKELDSRKDQRQQEQVLAVSAPYSMLLNRLLERFDIRGHIHVLRSE